MHLPADPSLVPDRRAALALLIAVAAAPEVLAQGATASSAAEFARQAEALKPGQWVWAPQIAPTGPLLIYVDLARQLATVYRNGVRIAVSTVSSGKPGHETPTGVFTILQKDANHRSSKYNNAPMPFQQRLTWDGVALHAGGLPGYPESHGCVHLPYAFSRSLFGITNLGATVIVAGKAADHTTSSAAGVLATTDEPLSGNYRWTPERSPRGPLTVVVSKRDQAIVVLRNGVEIGRSAARIDDDDPGTHVIHLVTGADGAPHWLYVGLAGHEGEAGREIDEATLNKVRMPAAFYRAVRAAAEPGATILVTDAGVGEGDSGRRLTIMDAVVPRP